MNVRRPNRDFLLKIKEGYYEYDELQKMTEAKQDEMEKAFKCSTLSDQPDLELINALTFELRNKFYEAGI